MFDAYKKILDLLDARERKRFFLLVAMSVAMGVVETAGVVSVVPFIAVAANPEVIRSSGVLSEAYALLRFESDSAFLIALGFLVLAILVGGIAFRTLTFYALTRFARMRELTLGRRLLARYLAQPYEWYLTRHTADVARRLLSEVQQVVNGSVMTGMRLIASGAVTLCLVSLLLLVEPVGALVMGGLLAGAYGAVFLVTRRALARMGEERVRMNRERYQIVQEAFGGIKDVKLFNLEKDYLRRFTGPTGRIVRLQAKMELLNETPRNALEALTFGGMILFVLWILAAEPGGMMEALPILGLYAFAGVRLFPALQKLYSGLSTLRFHKAALDELCADLSAAIVGGVLASARGEPMRLREAIELEDVVYSFPNADHPALDGLSLRVPARTTVGVVGATGAGKTTAVDVMLGLLTPQKGIMRVDGVVIGRDNVRVWQRSVGYVPQHIYLLDDTVAANIAFGEEPEDIDRRAVERAARIANLHEFVLQLPEGYDTMVGERGARLSGGQRQRVGIARALYRDPDVLVFDEATSALDNLTEKAVMEAVQALGQEKTIVMIAHRLSTVRKCDTIFFMEAGRVIAADDYDGLVRSNPTFRALHEAAA